MKLINLEYRASKIGKTPLPNELHIKEPSQFELEQAIARAEINNLDTIVVYMNDLSFLDDVNAFNYKGKAV